VPEIHKGDTVTSPDSGAGRAADLPDYAPIPRSALGPALNDQGYYVGRVERNLYYATDGVYQAAFLATGDGVVLFDAPPSIGGNLRQAVDEIAAAEGVTNKVTHMVYSHHHDDHTAASSIFGSDVVRIGHEETRRLLLRANNPARPAPDVTFADSYTLQVGGERVELAWHGPNHSPDNIYIHFPDHDAVMFIDVVNGGWVPIYNLNLSADRAGRAVRGGEDRPGPGQPDPGRAGAAERLCAVRARPPPGPRRHPAGRPGRRVADRPERAVDARDLLRGVRPDPPRVRPIRVRRAQAAEARALLVQHPGGAVPDLPRARPY
jgi:glyoxylase-like metal-dependent hydrolase (beta-lactamase superfamily II)